MTKEESEEIFKMDEEIEEEKPKKPKKARKPVSPATKERLKAQLAKGRATAVKNRQKRALAKKIDREEAEKELDKKIAQLKQLKDVY